MVELKHERTSQASLLLFLFIVLRCRWKLRCASLCYEGSLKKRASVQLIMEGAVAARHLYRALNMSGIFCRGLLLAKYHEDEGTKMEGGAIASFRCNEGTRAENYLAGTANINAWLPSLYQLIIGLHVAQQRRYNDFALYRAPSTE